jgi:hypothetical protein
MALPGVPQTFAIEDAKAMTEKLWWEIETFRDEQNLEHKLWRAFNCAVTAWHIIDWLWKERRRDDRWKVGKLEKFQETMERRSRELRLCRFIANASKHGGVDRKPDPTIQVTVKAKDMPPSSDEVDDSRDWEIVISDRRGEQDALQVFYKVQSFLDHEVRALPPNASQAE